MTIVTNMTGITNVTPCDYYLTRDDEAIYWVIIGQQWLVLGGKFRNKKGMETRPSDPVGLPLDPLGPYRA